MCLQRTEPPYQISESYFHSLKCPESYFHSLKCPETKQIIKVAKQSSKAPITQLVINLLSPKAIPYKLLTH